MAASATWSWPSWSGSPSPCSRRVKALEDAGLIDTHVTLLNARQLGLTLTAYIHISMDRHTSGAVRELRSRRQGSA